MEDQRNNVSPVVKRASDLWSSSYEETELKEALNSYRGSIAKKIVFIAVCITAAFVVSGISLGTGSSDFGFVGSYKILWNHITGVPQNKLIDYIIWNERLPPILMGLIGGAGLAMGGVVMQGIFRNPLADPYTTGISSGAGFGATLAVVAGITIVSGKYALVINAFVFALIPVMLITSVARMKGASPTTMIMAGIAVMYIFGAFTTLFKLMADPNALSALFIWQTGSLGLVTWEELPLVFAVTVAGLVYVQINARKLNVLSTGEETAKSMGINVENLTNKVLLVMTLVVATIVSFTGLIGFVGLVSPHIARMVVGADNRFLLPASAAFGGMLLVISDLIGRTIIAPSTLQVGVIMAFIGGPMFLYLILRRKKSTW
ncbi:MAG: FecCD family ABC transporter permease [Candidatus Methanomethylophilaceae archaeon]|jgi:iron complex transport system permease protein